MFGYARDELLGQAVEVLLPERFRRRHPEHVAGYVAAPSLRPMGMGLELSARRKDGTEFPVEISLSPMESEQGVLVFSSIRDVTERKRMVEALRESEAQLHLIMDSVPVLIAYLDKGLRYRFVNRTFEHWHGRSATDIVGTHLSDIRSEGSYHQLRQYSETALAGQPLTIETSMPDRHGGSRDVHATYVPHVDQ